MTTHEALERLEHQETLYVDVKADCEAIGKAIEALEKQIPKKPNSIFCPTCGDCSIIDGEYGYGYSHCYNCGQAIDWSEE